MEGKVVNLRAVMGSRQDFHHRRRELVRVSRAVRLPLVPQPVRNVRLFVPTATLEASVISPELDLMFRVSLVLGGMIQEQHVLNLRIRTQSSPEICLEPCEGACPVCGNVMDLSRVDCPRCETPHHRECWEYFGGCTTYACGSKFVAAKLREGCDVPSI
jgi:hypothetical protein